MKNSSPKLTPSDLDRAPFARRRAEGLCGLRIISNIPWVAAGGEQGLCGGRRISNILVLLVATTMHLLCTAYTAYTVYSVRRTMHLLCTAYTAYIACAAQCLGRVHCVLYVVHLCTL